ncbi:MAG: primosomal protein N' [Clostridiales bacterium]|nr:primosomal protein N' [Clostridiales bacterium]
MPIVAKLAVQAATYAIDKAYDYLLPDELSGRVGCRVLVPFGRGNRLSEGVILSLHQEVPAKPLKAVRSLLDDEPVVTEKELRLALWMSRRYFCTFYDALRTILPAAVWYRYREIWSMRQPVLMPDAPEREQAVARLLQDGPLAEDKLCQALGDDIPPLLRRMEKAGTLTHTTEQQKKVRDKVVAFASLCVPAEQAADLAGRSSKRREVVSFLARNGETALHDLRYFTGAAKKTVDDLCRLGAVSLREQEEYRISEKQYAVKATDIILNDEQQRVCDALLAQIDRGEAGVTLLLGVTGSGKTMVYIRLAQLLLERGKSVMILVPEIALTPQMMARFTAYFGDRVALLHSGLRMTERYDQYKRIRRGEARIVLGTRSAVFAPLVELGLIIMDEEQEGSYESENAPCYHARDVAKYRCAQEGARLLLGSATPTVETAWHAERGDYGLLELRQRFNRQALPRVIVADLRHELRQGRSTVISQPLYNELQKNMAAGEQSILFLNRRGSSRQLLCPQCSYVPECPRCSVYLTYHSANDRLMCHYCGFSQPAPERCPDCGGALKHIGFGTQRVEEELHELFPGTEVLRMDADTVSAGHEALLRQFEERRVPILLGTQMVAKGLDFENVTLVGVLSADLSLYVDHYRAAERTFNLLTQVVGRAGRGAKKGRAVIQTYTPENDVIQAAAAQDYERFYRSEIQLRRLRRDPPFADQFIITVSGGEEDDVRRAVGLLRSGLDAAVKKPPYDDMGLELIGPAPAPVVRVNGSYRYRLLLLGENNAQVRGLLSSFMRAFAQRAENRRLHIRVDCDLMD